MSHLLKEVMENISIDCVIIGFEKSEFRILLKKREAEPFKGMWALPGGFLKQEELVKDSVKRILKNATGAADFYLEEFALFDQIDRYPLRRVLTIGHFALISPENYISTGEIESYEAKWFKLNGLPEMPFDHKLIIKKALVKLRESVREKPIGFELLPKKFTLPQLQTLYEIILNKKLDKRNFRKKLFKMELVAKLDEKDRINKRRIANLYKFERQNYEKMQENGITFDL